MALTPGTRLGPYEIIALIGAGGMGEVYKARDTRLDRTVAIKILPDTVATDRQLRERFDREARAVSQLDHPNICTLYDVGQENATAYLVMQYLEGETLEARLKKGALPLDQALAIAIQIASALDKAHRVGIVHRDLKPGNIMLTKAGAKLLDFGLAKRSVPVANGGLSMLPTTPPASLDAITVQGTILGTFQYMAPEQLEGEDADARTDLFAFGAVLYEMLTGRKAFAGKSQASLVGAILHADPPAIRGLAPLVPPALERVVLKCLRKDPAGRWQSAADLADELSWLASGGVDAERGGPVAQASGRRERWVWVSALALGAIVVGLAARVLRRAPLPPEMHVEISVPPTTDPVSLALSPDGQQVAFVAAGDPRIPQLWVRRLDSGTDQALAGTDGAAYPFWSPDNRSLGFIADNKLKRVDLADGAVRIVTPAVGSRRGAWTSRGVMLFSAGVSPLQRIPAEGGTPTAATRLDPPRQSSHTSPDLLPDGRHFLFFSSGTEHGVYIGDLDTLAASRLIDSDGAAEYSAAGYLLFVREGTLYAQRFDANRRTLSGEPIRLAQGIAADAVIGSAAVSVSETGTIAYRTGSVGRQRQFVWFDRTGRELQRVGEPMPGTNASAFALSPDGRDVAVPQPDSGTSKIWLLELARGVMSRFTSGDASENFPVWAPDARRVVYQSNRRGPIRDLYVKTLGQDDETLLLSSPLNKAPKDWSTDGHYLLYNTFEPTTGADLYALRTDGDRTPVVVARTPFDERDGQFSPDGRWVAYESNESGQSEIYLQPFPGPGAKMQVSTHGGAQVRWRGDGRELFYVALDETLMAVPLRLGVSQNTGKLGAPVPLFPVQIGGAVQSFGNSQQYAVAADGQRFLVRVVIDDVTTSPIELILNWRPKP